MLSDEEIDNLQRETLRVIEEREDKEKPQPVWCHNMTGDPANAVWQIVDIFLASEPFRNLVHHPAIAEDIATLTKGDVVRLWHDQVQYKPATVGGANHWHQDSPYWPPLTPKDEQVTAWVALDDADEENGCMVMVPGSHLWGVHVRWLESLEGIEGMPNEFGGEKIEVRSCPVKKGHVHYHHSLTWHGSTKNRSGRPRRAIALHYMTGRTRYAACEGAHPMTSYIESPIGAPVEGKVFPKVWPR